MNLNLFFSEAGLSQTVSQDVILFLFLALLSFVYAMFIGKNRVMTVLVNIYVAFAVTSVVPKDWLSGEYYQSLIFLIILFGMTSVSRKFFDLSFTSGGSGFLWRIFLMSFLQLVLVLSILVSFLPKKTALAYVSSSAYGYLTSGWMPLLWMVLPLVYMLFIYKRYR